MKTAKNIARVIGLFFVMGACAMEKRAPYYFEDAIKNRLFYCPIPQETSYVSIHPEMIVFWDKNDKKLKQDHLECSLSSDDNARVLYTIEEYKIFIQPKNPVGYRLGLHWYAVYHDASCQIATAENSSTLNDNSNLIVGYAQIYFDSRNGVIYTKDICAKNEFAQKQRGTEKVLSVSQRRVKEVFNLLLQVERDGQV